MNFKRKDKIIFNGDALIDYVSEIFGWIIARTIFIVLHSELENLDKVKGLYG